jgi:peptidoglycan/LPS O-acetylase OafA/YrhL
MLMVLAFHATRQATFTGAFVGVEMFFVLSGFLITTLLIDEFASAGRVSLTKFYARRALRLFPALILFLGACLVIYARVNGGLETLMTRFLVATTFYCANLFEAFGHHLYWAHTWSLSAEEQYYLVWPILLVIMLRARLSPRLIVLLTAAAFVAASIPRIILWRYGAHHEDVAFVFYSPFTHADGLLLGCLLGELYAWDLLPSGEAWRRAVGAGAVASLAISVVVLFTLSRDSAALYDGGYSLVFLSCAVLILGCIERDPARPLRLLEWRPLTYTGEISYGLYLWNPLFLFNYPGSAINPFIAVVLSVGVAAASFRWVEKPALQLKSRFTPVRHQQPVVVEPAPLEQGRPAQQ